MNHIGSSHRPSLCLHLLAWIQKASLPISLLITGLMKRRPLWLLRPGLTGYQKVNCPDFVTGENSHYLHYNSIRDPLRISNLGEDILQPLQEVLANGDVRIKHVMVFKMESTRQDVFPLKKDSYFHERIKQSYGKDIPKDVQKRLANITRTVERLTGSQSGFNEQDPVNPLWRHQHDQLLHRRDIHIEEH